MARDSEEPTTPIDPSSAVYGEEQSVTMEHLAAVREIMARLLEGAQNEQAAQQKAASPIENPVAEQHGTAHKAVSSEKGDASTSPAPSSRVPSVEAAHMEAVSTEAVSTKVVPAEEAGEKAVEALVTENVREQDENAEDDAEVITFSSAVVTESVPAASDTRAGAAPAIPDASATAAAAPTPPETDAAVHEIVAAEPPARTPSQEPLAETEVPAAVEPAMDTEAAALASTAPAAAEVPAAVLPADMPEPEPIGFSFQKQIEGDETRIIIRHAEHVPNLRIEHERQEIVVRIGIP